LFVVYQPQIALLDRRFIGLEALVRWRTESGQMIGPDRFIPVAEQSGLIREIGFFVLRRACAALSELHREGCAALRMAVNVSAIQFRHPAFLTELRQIITDSGIDPCCLELEITESIAMEDAAYVRETLDALHGMGVQLAIDDFGTGYSSLAQLKGMAVDRLKIDRAFVSDLDAANAEASIAGVVIQLGQRLGKEVIAEGVETEDQAALLKSMGCPDAQGYLFGRPMPLDDLQVWIKQRGGC
jgi:EAL domain-containing protein (putative c-di-GMP-specific phosphodiesterase class I)